MRHALGEAPAVGALAVAVIGLREGIAVELPAGVAKLDATRRAAALRRAVAMTPVARAAEQERPLAPPAIEDEENHRARSRAPRKGSTRDATTCEGT